MLQGGEKKIYMPSLRGSSIINDFFLFSFFFFWQRESSHYMNNINHVFFFTFFLFPPTLQQFCLWESKQSVSLDSLISPELQSSEKCCRI